MDNQDIIDNQVIMDNQKRENLLNLSLNVSEEERNKSIELGVGFDPESRLWDVIVRYSGDILQYASETLSIVPLLGNYAIITLTEEELLRLTTFPEIEYIEKPKRLFFSVNNGRAASCINQLQTGSMESTDGNSLFGRGVLVGIVDSGIDYRHPDFRNEDGTTRIIKLWDQTIRPERGFPPPPGYRIGAEFTSDQINEALSQPTRQAGDNLVPSLDLSGHGTSVAGIAAGNGRASDGLYRGVAPMSTLIVVKLGTPLPESFPRTTELMQAVDYIVKQAIELGMPVAINLSFGNTYGSHDGSSLLETYIDNAASLGRTSIAVGTGNEGAAAGHTSGILQNGLPLEVELAVSVYETTLNVQIWKYFNDMFQIEIMAPSGERVGPFRQEMGPQRYSVNETDLLLYYGEPSPYSIAQEIFIDFLPKNSYINSGIWTFRFIPERIIHGEFHMWLPSASILNYGTRFLLPTPDITLTIPSTATKVISVGAYDSSLISLGDFSGRGYTRVTNLVKPDLVAPGVNITTTAVGGGYTSATGTSFATPFVTGSSALLMEYGIIQRNDPFLYGEKLKAYLIAGTRPLSFENEYPNPRVGYGALCLWNSFLLLTR